MGIKTGFLGLVRERRVGLVRERKVCSISRENAWVCYGFTQRKKSRGCVCDGGFGQRE